MRRTSLKTRLPLVLLLALSALPALAAPASLSPASAPFFAAADPHACKGNDQCAQEEFCAKLFGRCGDAGKCEARPADCIEHGGKVLVRPVCGCDGKDYDSVCVAAIAGVSVAHEGSCKP